MPKRRYNWAIRTLENWADHWIRAARVHEIQTSSQLWDKIKEGRLAKPNRNYMKVPSKNQITAAHVTNFPIMDDWMSGVEAAIDNLSRLDQTVVFERYFGQVWGRYDYAAWAKEIGLGREAYKQRLKRAHRSVAKQLDYTRFLDTSSVHSKESS